MNGSVLNGHPSKYSFTIVHHYYNKCFGKNVPVSFLSFHYPQIFYSPACPNPAPGSQRQIVRCLPMTIRFHQNAEVTWVWNS